MTAPVEEILVVIQLLLGCSLCATGNALLTSWLVYSLIIQLPESLVNKLLLWQKRLPIREDFVESNYFLFYEYNWIHILYGLNLLDIDNLKKQSEMFNSDVLFNNVIQLNNFKNSFTEKSIKHKEFLEKIRIS